MKKIILTMICLGCTFVAPAHGYVCSMEYCPDGMSAGLMIGCSSVSLLGCLGGKAISTCTKCKSGYNIKHITATYSAGGCTYEYDTCERACTGCSNCASDSDWSAGNTGYQKKTTRTCSCNTCNEITTYRCAPGYYGTSTNGTSGCTICPTANSMTGTSAAGSTSQTSCYIPSDTSNNDSAGIFTFTENCYYGN